MRSRLQVIWTLMKQRCLNQNCPAYNDYGGRGITICQEWINSYKKFESWSYNNGYEDVLTIDRIDNDGNYEPSNCRWVTMAEQSINKGMYKNNSTGIRGVYIHRDKYRAEIKIKGRTVVLGQSDDINIAAALRKQGELLYYGKILD